MVFTVKAVRDEFFNGCNAKMARSMGADRNTLANYVKDAHGLNHGVRKINGKWQLLTAVNSCRIEADNLLSEINA